MESRHQIAGLTVFSRPVKVGVPLLLCIVPLLSGCGGDAANDTAPSSSAQSNSAQSAAPAEGALPVGWETLAPEGSGFSVLMPSEPKKETEKNTTPNGERVTSGYFATSNGVSFELSHTAYQLAFMKIFGKDKNRMQGG